MKKHGYSRHPLYAKFNQMKQRCYNKNSPLYPSYGGKGITICDEWLQDISKFIEWGMENGYNENTCSINRIDPKKGYSPDNCNFMTVSENSTYHPDRIKYVDFRQNVTVYCKNEEIATQVRIFAKILNAAPILTDEIISNAEKQAHDIFVANKFEKIQQGKDAEQFANAIAEHAGQEIIPAPAMYEINQHFQIPELAEWEQYQQYPWVFEQARNALIRDFDGQTVTMDVIKEYVERRLKLID